MQWACAPDAGSCLLQSSLTVSISGSIWSQGLLLAHMPLNTIVIFACLFCVLKYLK